MSSPSDTQVENVSKRRTPTRTATLALAGIIGPIWSTALIVVQGILQPDYSHIRMPISALAAWPTGWIQNLNFYVMGALTIIFAFALHRGVRPTPRGGTGVALLAIGGLGLVLGLIVFSRRMTADSRWRHLATYTLGSGIAVLVLFVLVGFFAVDDGAPLHSWTGLLQRVLVAVWCLWMIALAVRVRAVAVVASRESR